MVKITQRLAPFTGAPMVGLQPLGLVAFLDTLEQTAREILEAAPAFSTQKVFSVSPYYPFLSLREIYQSPSILSKIALKGDLDYPLDNSDPAHPKSKGKRLDSPLSWQSVIARLLERGFVKKLFESFDPEKKGYISLKGSQKADVEDVLDLSVTLLGLFASYVPESTGYRSSFQNLPLIQIPNEERIPLSIPIKPMILSKIFSLLEEPWTTDGVREGKLDADGLYSAIKYYDQIQLNLQELEYSLDLPHQYVAQVNSVQSQLPDEIYLDRHDFIKALPSGLRRIYPHLFSSISEANTPLVESLLHSLIEVPLEPMTLYSIHNYSKVVKEQAVQFSSALAPLGLFTLLDRIMLYCDQDEDEELNWAELDCAAPLILEAGYLAVSSEIMDLDAPFHDRAKMLLKYLNNKGRQLEIAKLVLSNGTLEAFNFQGGIWQWLRGSFQFTAPWNWEWKDFFGSDDTKDHNKNKNEFRASPLKLLNVLEQLVRRKEAY
jgi:hypothetical protein